MFRAWRNPCCSPSNRTRAVSNPWAPQVARDKSHRGRKLCTLPVVVGLACMRSMYETCCRCNRKPQGRQYPFVLRPCRLPLLCPEIVYWVCFLSTVCLVFEADWPHRQPQSETCQSWVGNPNSLEHDCFLVAVLVHNTGRGMAWTVAAL